MKLFRRGLLITTVPLLCHVILVGCLAISWGELHSELVRVQRCRVRASQLNAVGWESIQGVFQAFMNSDTLGLADPETTKRERAKFIKRIKQLLDLKWTTEEWPHVKALHDTSDSMMRGLSWVQREQSQGEEHWKVVQKNCYDLIYTETLRFIDCTQGLADLEEAQLKSSPATLARSRSTIHNALVYAVPISLLVSFILALFYSLGISRPLKRIIANGQLLSKRLPLQPPLAGEDELCKLDRLIHAVSASVEEAMKIEKSTLANAASLVCSLDEHAIFTRSNPYTQRLLGLAPDELVGLSMLDFVVEEERCRAESELAKARSNTNTHGFDLRLKHVDGTIYDTRWSVFWSDNQSSFFCVASDVSEQRKIERMKQDFMDMISHDLRSPLMSMSGSITLMLAGAKGSLPAEIEKDMERSRTNVDRLIGLVSDLLDFQQLQSDKMIFVENDFALRSMMDACKELVEGIAQAKRIEIILPEGNWIVRGDKQRLQQAFLNLLSNAIKFSPEAEQITVHVEDTEQCIEVSISDCGPGIPEDSREKIFQAFEQVPGQKSKEGTGLGLAICRLIIEGHGGALGVRDRNDGKHGSTFWFNLNKNK